MAQATQIIKAMNTDRDIRRSYARHLRYLMRIFGANCEARSLHLAIDLLIFTLPLQHAQPCDGLEEFRERQELHLGEITQFLLAVHTKTLEAAPPRPPKIDRSQ